MRSRERTLNYVATSNREFYQRYHHVYWDTNTYTQGVMTVDSMDVWRRHEVIEDALNEKKGFKINSHRPWLNPVHVCYHQKEFIKFNEEKFFVSLEMIDPGWEETFRTEHYSCPAMYMAAKCTGTPFGTPFVAQPLNTAADFANVEWPILLDAFKEACNSRVPQAFFMGEDAKETTPILVSAFKVLLNPSKAVLTTVKLMKRLMKDRKRLLSLNKSRSLRNLSPVEYARRKKDNVVRRKLRTYARQRLVMGDLKALVSGTAKMDLTYKFAVKPAIEDIRHSLASHSIIEEKLAFLASKRGTFVPIKVRRKFNSATTSYTIPARPATVPSYYDIIRSKDKIGMISCWAKVRSDQVVQPRWKAYAEYFGLNKVLGTVWELVPFSFVIDWVTNAQEMVNKMTAIELGSPYTELTTPLYTTIERTVFARYVQVPLHQDSSWTSCGPSTPTHVLDYQERTYSRVMSYPASTPHLDFSGIGKGKLLSLGELAIQFIR